MSKIKICILAPQLDRLVHNQPGFGGAEVEAHNLATGLANDPNYEVTVIVVNSEALPSQIYNNFKIITVRKYHAQVGRGQFILYLVRLFFAAWRTRARVYINFPASLETIVLSWAAALRRKKLIYRVVHDWETNFSDLDSRIFQRQSFWGRSLAKRFVAVLKHAIITVSKNEQKQHLVQNFGLLPEKISIINNLVLATPDHNLPKEYILWVSRIHPSKHPEKFLELAKYFVHEKFLMLGLWSEGCDPLYKKTLADAKAIPNLEFVPGLPWDRVGEYYQKAKFLVFTSEAEGQSNILVEAWLAGLPTISLSFDPDGVITRNKIGIVCGGDDKKLTQATQQLISEPQLRDEMSKIALRVANNQFDFNQTLEQYKQLILMI